MPSFTYNEGAYQLRNGGSVDFAADTIEYILVSSGYTPDKDDDNTVLAAAEISGVTGYTGGFGGSGRKTLASKTLTKDTVNDRIVYDAADPSNWTLGVGDDVLGVVVAKKGSADDTTAVLLFFLEITGGPIPTNGSTFTFAVHANGLGYTQQ